MIAASQIREVLSAYLSTGDADKFVQNFSALSRNIHKNGDAEAVKLANSVELKMADLHASHISKAVFIDYLRHLAQPSFSWVSYYIVGFSQFSQSINQYAVPENQIPEWVAHGGNKSSRFG